MASAIQGSVQQGQIPGGNGRTIQWGQFAFTTTGATCTIPVNMRLVESVIVLPTGAPATDEEIYWNDAPSQGRFVVPATGLITLGRTGASKTSGLGGSYFIIGM